MAVIELPDHVVARLRKIAASEDLKVDEWIIRMLDVEPELRMFFIEAESAASLDAGLPVPTKARVLAALDKIRTNLRQTRSPGPEQDDAGEAWETGVAREWSGELSDPREDIYNLEDGEPVNAAG